MSHAIEQILEHKHLLSFWDFSEEAGQWWNLPSLAIFNEALSELEISQLSSL